MFLKLFPPVYRMSIYRQTHLHTTESVYSTFVEVKIQATVITFQSDMPDYLAADFFLIHNQFFILYCQYINGEKFGPVRHYSFVIQIILPQFI